MFQWHRRNKESYLRTVQESVDSVDVGVGANHHGM